MALSRHMQRKPRNDHITVCTEEASQWTFHGIYGGSEKNLIMHGGIIYRKIELWLFKDKKKN